MKKNDFSIAYGINLTMIVFKFAINCNKQWAIKLGDKASRQKANILLGVVPKVSIALLKKVYQNS